MKLTSNHVYTLVITKPAEVVPKLDYFTEHQSLLTSAPALDIHVFTIPGESTFVVMSNYNNNGPR